MTTNNTAEKTTAGTNNVPAIPNFFDNMPVYVLMQLRTLCESQLTFRRDALDIRKASPETKTGSAVSDREVEQMTTSEVAKHEAMITNLTAFAAAINKALSPNGGRAHIPGVIAFLKAAIEAREAEAVEFANSGAAYMVEVVRPGFIKKQIALAKGEADLWRIYVGLLDETM